ncbi:TPA: TonB-dependent siderophore receptor [Elizabethkingia anophelis]|uniref:TonB-dependent siderophore receptor n=1 Tax=Elizabethkingia anophelis TaxID=1117645 RepID=UPI000423D2B6|nr:TonB-dependent siderophore receptor [Elizabethkingia anophelis]MCT3744060.1 TonB-dependent siderophore receptor [Elizabethkingia anophelis]MDC8026591.1 TonB-dependent siderophore receptor [Elizabethkingia anophelis]MDV3491797.1 TonB-dependent siderophore receptor [Elizabethkingia anophelis]MDV4129495.1 TonB-dependent siderophore receptor [Elizabethkingia anophelis]MDV4135361.1 TonB-dependent siderophore receptor [Elizabethkingia anophelis]
MNKYITTSFFVLGGLMVNAQTKKTDTLSSKDKEIEQVELFGERNKKPQGLEVITRLPLKTRDQIQSISVISYKVIEDLGGLTVTDVAKNIPGVTQFGSYGGTRESMSIRGYRGVPVLKNGVQLDSDFRTAGMLTDMQGVESIQVIKGSAAVTQGIGDGLGSAGGVINVVTKVPKFINQTNVGFRYGSWDFYRPTLDFQRVLDSKGRVAVRFNGAYQNSNSFRRFINTERIYVNPSIAIRPDDKTEIVMEMDYMHNNTTPDRGTVNLAKGDVEAIYNMPGRKFLGFSSDNAKTETFNFSTTASRKLTDKLKLRAAFISSSYQSEIIGAALAPVDRNNPNQYRNRTLTRSDREDLNKVFQFDFIGADVMTGFMKHTFQVGFDWKESNVTTTSYKSKNVDRINVLEDINNALPGNIDAKNFDLIDKNPIINTKTPTVGLMAQDVITFNRYIKAHLGIRYSRLNGSDKETSYAWNPSFGIMLSPIENVNVFGSYTSTTSLRSSNNVLASGGTVGASTTKQWEAGIKSDWLNERLRFNVTLFDIKTDNLSYEVLTNSNSTGTYALAGNLKRRGVEVELIGKILPNLQVMTGWAYVDAQYKDSPSFVNGSAPINTPKHSANAWLNYRFNQGILEGLDVGAGIYYVGKRPVDDYKQTYSNAANGHVNGTLPGEKPFKMPDYTTVDAQLGYALKNGFGVRVFFNNIFDRVGYSSYFRGGYIDQIQPRNFAVQLNYKF